MSQIFLWSRMMASLFVLNPYLDKIEWYVNIYFIFINFSFIVFVSN